MSREQLEDHEIVAMTQQYSQDRKGSYVTHVAYEEINRQGEAGRQWAKCPNCGNPFPLDKSGAGGTVCSERCHDQYVDYLMNP